MDVRKRIRKGLLGACVALSMLPLAAVGALDSDKSASVSKSTSTRAATAARPPAPPALRTPAEVYVVGGLAGQPGYVHYFVITGPDGEPETQIGIELEDGRVAWSFPEAGVFIAPFLAAGSFTIGPNRYEIEHLYGLRPFRDEASMRAFARELASRMGPYLAEKTPYCDENGNADRFCLSCLGFVLRVLYPGSHVRGFPALPADFKAARRTVYSTEDLLLYLTGIPVDGTRATRGKRIDALSIPDALREELTRISTGIEQLVPAVANAKPKRTVPAKSRTAARPLDAPRRTAGRGS